MSSFRRTAPVSLWLLVVFGLCTASCGSSSSAPVAIWPTLGEIYQMMLDSTAPDTDGDSIPDDVELDPILGTDPNRSDTDRDGLNDLFEVFGPYFLFVVTDGQAGQFDPDDTLKDRNRNLEHAAVDEDETSEELMVDDDNDGVFSYLEYYGYTYDWTTGEFMAWNEADRQAQPNVPWYKTDPLQWSTDQDAYSDGTEVSTALMDVAIDTPGEHPFVPAYPNVVVTLAGYTVTLNEEITYSRGGALEKGQSWSREVTNTHSRSEHYDWEVGVEGGWDGGIVAKAHFNFAWGNETTNTTSTAVAVGGTVNEEVNWNKARSYNPTEAAHIKLFLKVQNCGTAPASNVIPTLNLRIGGSNVATFEQANFQINMLMPGETYPADDSVYWVVDTIDTGTGGVPLALTEWELKSLESGAPVTIAVTQCLADVMRMDDEGGWERMGDANEFVARCHAVSANIYADLGDGKFMHHLVYADDSPTAPPMTLREALACGMGATESGGEMFLEYTHANGETEQVQITDQAGGEGWTVHVDSATYERMGPGTDLFDMRLYPGSHVELMAPRPSDEEAPVIYDAYARPLEEGYDVVACASDYDGIDSVLFVDRYGEATEMEPDGRGPWYFSCRIEDQYEFAGGEKVVVTSVNPLALTAEHPVEVIHTIVSEPPVIARLVYDTQNRVLQAKVSPGGDMAEDAIAWVRLYHESFLASETKEERDGYITMKESIYWFEDPEVYDAEMPHGWLDDMRIVASSAGGLYTASGVANVATILPYGSGRMTMQAEIDWTATDAWEVPQVDLDDRPSGTVPYLGHHSWWQSPWGNFHGGGGHFDDGWPSDGIDYLRLNSGSLSDIYFRSLGDDDNRSSFLLGCEFAGIDMDPAQSGKSPEVYYLELTKKEVMAAAPSFVDGGAFGFTFGTVLAFKTTDGRYGKLIVRATHHWKDDDWILFVPIANWDKRTVMFDYVLFRQPGDGNAPPAMSYETPDAYYTINEKITPNRPVFQGDGDPPDEFELTGSLPAGLVFNELTGEISGTPTAALSATTYTVTGSNTGGTTQATVTIAVLAPPSNLVYTTPVSYPTGTAITPNSPTWSGTVESFAIGPALPAGLSLDTTTGVISGTPVAVSAAKNYTVTASNRAGASTTAIVNLATPLGAPKDLSYSVSPASYPTHLNITPNVPTVTNPVDSWAISPALPAGLSFDTTTGVVSGKPTAVTPATGYTVTATNTAGSATVTLSIATPLGPPLNLSYAVPSAVYVTGVAITPNVPTVTNSPDTWSVSPALPTGLSINTSTGVISGTPTAATVATTYTVTATNSAGGTTATIVIQTVTP